MTPEDATPMEQLSAWMDGELPADQARFLERRLQSDAALRAQWERWQLSSDCLRGHALRRMPPSLASGVAAAIARSPHRRARWPWLAAAAAAMLVVVMLPSTPENLPGPPLLAPASTPASSPGAPSPAIAGLEPARSVAQSPVTAPGSVRDFPLAEIEGRKPWPRSPLLPETRSIEPYLVRHNALMAEDGLGGFVSYLDVVAHDADAETGTEAKAIADEPVQ